MKPLDYLILLCVFAGLFFALRSAVRRRKRGGGCCGDCARCRACANETQREGKRRF